jgi:hypothetical protein
LRERKESKGKGTQNKIQKRKMWIEKKGGGSEKQIDKRNEGLREGAHFFSKMAFLRVKRRCWYKS